MPAATPALGKRDRDPDAKNDDGIPPMHKDDHDADEEHVAAWVARQLASPVSLQSLRIVYDALVDRQHHNNQTRHRMSPSEQQQARGDEEPEEHNHLLRSLRLTCQLLLAIHRQELQPQQQQQQQQILTTSQQHCIETTERRCRWLLELVTRADDGRPTNSRLPVKSIPVGGSDYSGPAAGSDDGVITNLCRHSNPDPDTVTNTNTDTDTVVETVHPAALKKSGDTEWTYDYVAGTNDNDDDDDDDDGGQFLTRAQYATEANIVRDGRGYKNDNDSNVEHEHEYEYEHEYIDDDDDDGDDGGGGGNMLPSRAELAAEERMLWRMADTPIPTEP
jgi:hypothetical protein